MSVVAGRELKPAPLCEVARLRPRQPAGPQAIKADAALDRHVRADGEVDVQGQGFDPVEEDKLISLVITESGRRRQYL